ncbi:hypothetical protein [Marinilabilia rubra]|uniref:hypothetical protein n=1 Tax=Marinilabilia rubra TaxID=2162893 RepID=UPI0011B1E74E|nr:hypothetical protein [Marinilabilia rubra]
MKKFYGYGNLGSDFWFIGKEEAGGESQKDIEARLNAWKASNKSEVADLYEFHDRIFSYKSPETSNAVLSRFFDHTSRKFKLQRTWAGLIKLQLASNGAYDGKNCSIIKKYQSEWLGRFNSPNCLLELFPISSPSSKKFEISEWSDIEYLKDRKSYKQALTEIRINKIRKLIQEHYPKVVIFYSTDKEYLDYWHQIAGISFSEDSKIHLHKKHAVYLKKRENTVYVVIPHPTAFGISNKFWIEVGQELKKLKE